jgi:hypothetical protein
VVDIETFVTFLKKGKEEDPAFLPFLTANINPPGDNPMFHSPSSSETYTLWKEWDEILNTAAEKEMKCLNQPIQEKYPSHDKRQRSICANVDSNFAQYMLMKVKEKMLNSASRTALPMGILNPTGILNKISSQEFEDNPMGVVAKLLPDNFDLTHEEAQKVKSEWQRMYFMNALRCCKSNFILLIYAGCNGLKRDEPSFYLDSKKYPNVYVAVFFLANEFKLNRTFVINQLLASATFYKNDRLLEWCHTYL